MRVTMKSIFSGEVSSKELDITVLQYDHWRRSGLPIQACFPNLSTDDREFLLTGMTLEEFEKCTNRKPGEFN